MRKVINLYKPVSYTPLQVVEKFRQENSAYKDIKLGYAGRLDPMAEGVLLVLVGEENKKRTFYELLGKEYEFEVLFGISTDTYDVMGNILEVEKMEVGREKVLSSVSDFVGEWEQEYPPYSSVKVGGKPLYWWARRDRLSEIQIPFKKVRVEKVEVLGVDKIHGSEVGESAVSRISGVEGNFRQKDVVEGWKRFKNECAEVDFVVAKFYIKCSSGVYVRSMADFLGRRLGVPAFAYSILRTKVGEYGLSSSRRLGSIKRDG